MNEVELLRRMVEIPSLSGQEQELAAFLVQEMESLGISAEIDETGNVIGTCQGRGPVTEEVVLLGHMDTVPGEIPVRIEESDRAHAGTAGRAGAILYGRGTVDAKGPLATFIMATATAALPPGRRVVIIGAVEEESATSRGAHHVAPRFRPDWCIIGEPSNWDAVTLGYKGRLLVTYRHEQPSGHSAGPLPGVAEQAVDWWHAVQEHATRLNHGQERFFDQVLPSLRHISTTTDGLHDRVEVIVGLRLPPGLDREALQSALKEMAGTATLRFEGYVPAYQAARATEVVRSFQNSIRRQGSRPRFKVKSGTSDMNVVGPVWGCPLLAYGPGDSTLDHTPREHIALDEYRKAIEVLRGVLETERIDPRGERTEKHP